MKPFILLSLILFIFAIEPLTGQTPEIDDLKVELREIQDPSQKLDLIRQLISRSKRVNVDTALYYCQYAVQLLEECNCDEFHIQLFTQMVYAYKYNGAYKKAEEIGLKAIKISRALPPSDEKFWNYSSLAGVYSDLSQINESLNYYDTSYQIALQIKNDKLTGASLVNMASIYIREGSNSDAEKYLKKAIPYLERIQHYGFLGSAYFNLSLTSDSLKLGLFYLNKAEENYRQGDDIYKIANIKYALGNLHENNELYAQAIEYYKESIQLYGHSRYYANDSNFFSIGQCYLRLNKIDSAYHYLLIAETLYKDLPATHSIKSQLYFELFDVAGRKGAYQKAIHYAKTSFLHNDTFSLENEESVIQEYDIKYKTAEKEAEIAQQKLEIAQKELELVQQKRNQNRTLFGGILALLLTSGIYLWYYQTQHQKKKLAEEKAENLQKLDHLKSKFFTNISHELRTPLTLISGPIENAIEKAQTKSVQNDLQLAHSNSQKLLTLVNEILDLSKLESGKLELIDSEVNLNTLLRRILFSFQSLADLRNISLTLNNHINPTIFVKIDIEKFEKILNNLISNAIKYTATGGHVELNVKAVDEKMHLKVIDSGKGIHPDDLDKVFDRFYQSTQQGEPLQGGTGVGLALARELAKLFGGNLTVSSILGNGSTFTAILPLNHTTPRSQNKEETIAPTQKKDKRLYSPLLLDGKKPHLLIIEDHPEMSQYLVSLLSKDYDCSIAINGKKALQLLQKKSFDLITCDVMMPEMDGFELRKKLNEILENKYIPFIFITARSLEADKIKGLQLGVDDYITKPFSKTELLTRIHNLLNNKFNRDKWLKENPKETEALNDSSEDQFLKDMERIVLENLENLQFKVNDLAKEIGYSQRQLSRVLKKTTGISPVNFILEVRLQKARQILEQRRFATVSEVRYEVGIDSFSYFTKKFTARFGRNPKEYLKDS